MLSNFQKTLLIVFLGFAGATFISACKSTSIQSGPADETAQAGEMIKEANKDLKEIKKLYDANENKREDLKKALATDNVEAVRQITGELEATIKEGTGHGKNAREKIDKARDMSINDDYANYLKLKSDALNRQLEAFAEYSQAARKLRDNYDPKNVQVRETVKAEFKERSDNFQRLMERARELSSEANDFAKDVMQRQPGQ